jgi:sialate O-acetylesterase
MKHTTLLALLALSPLAARAELRLPAIIGDNMVLQQKQAGKIWGWDNPGADVTVAFGGQTLSAKADAKGKWTVSLNPGAANATPVSMTIKGSSTKELKNILVGEVWICSGQSNMQWNVGQSLDADLEIATAKYPKIRLISVPQVGTQEPQMTSRVPGLSARLRRCRVSAPWVTSLVVGLHQILDVPVGLINNAWGGRGRGLGASRCAGERSAFQDPDGEHQAQRGDPDRA